MNVRIASTSYAVPSGVETVENVLALERERVEAALAPLSARSRERALEGLGLERLRVCTDRTPYQLAVESADRALAQAGIGARDVQMIIDFSTFPEPYPHSLSFAPRLAAELGAETSMSLSFKAGGCGALHLAIKTALGWMSGDESIRNVLLVTGDQAPPGNRSLLPITVQGDAASAMVLSRDCEQGPTLLGTEALSLGYLHNAISILQHQDRVELRTDAVCIEQQVMPIYYLNFYRLIHKLLDRVGAKVNQVDRFVYSNISLRDREGFRRMLALPPDALSETCITEYGHTFASDLIINYGIMCERKPTIPGELLLFASAGIGFTWGVTLARA